MSEEMFAQFRTEGTPVFPAADPGTDNPADSQSDKTTTDITPAPGGDTTNNPAEKKEDPYHVRWQEHEKSWKERFNQQETRHQEDLRKIREEFGTRLPKDQPTDTKIPSWFGGDQEAWTEYQEHQNSIIAEAEERAVKRVSETKSQEEKRVADATDYMKSEITAIENDATLNPDGKKIDQNKLLNIVLENDLIDSQGRWNYKAAYRILRSQTPVAPPVPSGKDRKAVAGATTSESRAESKPTPFKTSADFKKNKPW